MGKKAEALASALERGAEFYEGVSRDYFKLARGKHPAHFQARAQCRERAVAYSNAAAHMRAILEAYYDGSTMPGFEIEHVESLS